MRLLSWAQSPEEVRNVTSRSADLGLTFSVRFLEKLASTFPEKQSSNLATKNNKKKLRWTNFRGTQAESKRYALLQRHVRTQVTDLFWLQFDGTSQKVFAQPSLRFSHEFAESACHWTRAKFWFFGDREGSIHEWVDLDYSFTRKVLREWKTAASRNWTGLLSICYIIFSFRTHPLYPFFRAWSWENQLWGQWLILIWMKYCEYFFYDQRNYIALLNRLR